jgi:Flp pilus assembly protein TadG
VKIREQRGMAAVEFAIVLPVLVSLLFGTIEFSLLLYNQQIITNASREGARFGILMDTPRKSEDQIRDTVETYCAGYLVSFGAAIPLSVEVTGAQGSFGEDLTVRVTHNYGFLYLSNLGFSPRDLVAQTVMKME